MKQKMENTNLQFSLQTHTDANKQEFTVLYKNEAVCTCPFRVTTILPHPTLQGQAIINNPICSSQCQFFDLTENKLSLLCSKFSTFVEKNQKSAPNHSGGAAPLILL